MRRALSRFLPCLLALSATGCHDSYLRRYVALRGIDVADHTRLPWREVPVGRPGAPLPFEPDTGWVARVTPTIGGTVVRDGAALDSVLAANGTTAFLVIVRDTLVDARYFNGAGPDSLFKSFSITKSMLAALIGIAEADGLLRRSDTVGVHLALPENPALAGVTLQHLLDNTSGILYRRGGAPWKDQPRMYYTTDARALVRNATVTQPAGARFSADDLSPILLGYVLEQALRTRTPGTTLSQFAATRLWSPMGAEAGARWNLDHEGDGLEKSESGLVARATDLARLGLLYLHDGRAGSTQVVPAEWVRNTVNGPEAGSPVRFREGFYHNLWWGATRPDRVQGDFYANGHFGQRIYVSPDRQLVLVRLGGSAGSVDWTAALSSIADRWR